LSLTHCPRNRGKPKVKGIFISNTELDKNGRDYLRTHGGIRFIGKQELADTFISAERVTRVAKPMVFDISGHEASTYVVDKTQKAVIAPLKASELIRMDGISNQALFAFNVRGPLGKTQVNRDIAESVRDKSRHKLFPLFHNGITVIAEKVDATEDEITVKNYYVVNGCQSLSELYNNGSHITDNLRVLVKLIEIETSSGLSEIVTTFSNNQNGVKARDFKSNNRIQIRLQNEVEQKYGSEFHFEIKRGEDNKGRKTLTNELAGLYLLAFDLKRPWDTHRKYQIFEDEHAAVFGRPVVTADRVILCELLAGRVQSAIGKLNNTLFAKYALSRFLVLYILRLILEADALGKKVIAAPEAYIAGLKQRTALAKAVDKVLQDIVIDLNAELAQVAEDFDYRGRLRDEDWVKTLSHRIVADHAKLVSRGRIGSFEHDFEEARKSTRAVGMVRKKKRH
jgi:hypothetical protein